VALSLTDFYARIVAEVQPVLGDLTPVRAALVQDALTAFCTDVEPEIGTTLSIVSGTTEYAIPPTLDKISHMQDSTDVEIVYSLNTHERTITLQTTPTAAATYTVYGTPRDIRTNASTIIAALSENYGKVLWLYIKAACYDVRDSDKATTMMLVAQSEGNRLRYYRNRNSDLYSQRIQQVDSRGHKFSDSDDADAITPNNDALYESDL